MPYKLKPSPIERGASSAPHARRSEVCDCKTVQLAIAAAPRKKFLRCKFGGLGVMRISSRSALVCEAAVNLLRDRSPECARGGELKYFRRDRRRRKVLLKSRSSP